MPRGIPNTKRYNLVMPEELYTKLYNMAERDKLPVLDIIRRLLKFGLLIDTIEHSKTAKLIIRENGEDREIIIL